MKKLAVLLGLLVSALGSSCDLFSAGSFPFAEAVPSACPGDTVIHRFARLKARGEYNPGPDFPDGPNEPPSPYHNFYFYSRENNCILYTAVASGTWKSSTVLLVSLKAPPATSEWQDFNHGLDKERQQKVLAWFNDKIKPVIADE